MDVQPTKDWTCPKCLVNKVKLKQFNPSEALYICEGEKCLYPLEALKKLPIVSRDVGSMPVSKNLLRELSLPESLGDDASLCSSHVDSLVQLASVRNHVSQAEEAQAAWMSLVERMEAEGYPVDPCFATYTDPDLVTLDNLSQSLQPFSKLLFEKSDDSGS